MINLGENNIIITPGANDQMSAKKAKELVKQISTASLIVCQNEIPEEANLEAFQIAKKHGGMSQNTLNKLL